MLTPGDEYPVHQTPEPLAIASAERNFYDRYFFNGYAEAGDLFFGAALGVYPQLEVMDAAFSVQRDGRQLNLRASRSASPLDRLDTAVGALRVEVLEPLRRLAFHVDSEELSARLEFTGRSAPLQEPRFRRRLGSRLLMDYTRMTQNGSWTGFLDFGDQRVELGPETPGTRDRSWGLRPVGAPDPQMADAEPQFFWLWAPLHFESGSLYFHVNADGDGAAWNRSARWVPDDAEVATPAADPAPEYRLSLRPGSRHAEAARLEVRIGDEPWTVELDPIGQFYMSGLGYLHPEWGHGSSHGALAQSSDAIELAAVDPTDPRFLHVQSLCRASLRRAGGTPERGLGVLEQLILGPFEPLGLTGLFEPG